MNQAMPSKANCVKLSICSIPLLGSTAHSVSQCLDSAILCVALPTFTVTHYEEFDVIILLMHSCECQRGPLWFGDLSED